MRLFSLPLVILPLVITVAQLSFGDTMPLKEDLKKAVHFAENDDYSHASLAMEALLERFTATYQIHDDRILREYRAYLRLLAYYYFQQKSFSETERVMNLILTSPGYRTTSYEEENGLFITRDILFLWYVLSLQNQETKARNILVQQISESKAHHQLCYVDFAIYLLEEISTQDFLVLKKANPSLCRHYGAASEALVSFWVGEKALLKNDTETARLYLKQFLYDSTKEDIFERGIAFQQLEIPPSDRILFLKKASKGASQCYCSILTR